MINCGTPCKTAVVMAIVAAVVLVTGCSGTVKQNINTTQTVTSLDANNKPVTVVTNSVQEIEKPKDIAHEESVADKHAACTPEGVSATPMSLGLVGIDPMELKSGAAQVKYMDSVLFGQMAMTNQILATALKGDPTAACHQAVAKEAVAYYSMEAKRSSNRWGFGKFLAGLGITFLAVDAWTDAIASSGSHYYTTNVGNRSVGDATSGGGSGGGSVSASGDSTISDIRINNGPGNMAQDDGIAMTAEKGIGFTGDSNMDADGGGGTTGVGIQDDDGNGNSAGLLSDI